MKRYTTLALLLAVMIVAGCRTTEGYRQRLSQYIGATEAQLIDEWGVPSSTYDMDNGIKVLQYNNISHSYTSGPTYGFSHYSGRRYGSGIGYSAYVPLSPPPTVVTSTCQTLFKLDRKKRVIDTGFRGNACRAEEIDVE